MLKELLGSKKAWAAAVAAIVGLLGKKVGLDEDTITKVVGAIVAYILAQGVADLGKEAAKVKA